MCMFIILFLFISIFAGEFQWDHQAALKKARKKFQDRSIKFFESAAHSPLHTAALLEDMFAIKHFVEDEKLNINNLPVTDGETPLMYAAVTGNKSVIDY